MFNPRDFLKTAHRHAAGDEANIRTSIGRAYYSAFLIAREWLRTQGWTIHDDTRDHMGVQLGLKQLKAG